MGGCCSCGADPRQVDRDESEMANPMAPYADWAERLRADWGTDPTAVSRDYARMRIMVTGPDGPCTRLADISLTSDTSADEIARRSRDLRDVTLAISKLVEPDGSEVPAQLERAWQACIESNADLRGSPDVSSGLHQLFQNELKFYKGREDVTSDPRARSPTFNVLLLMAQGTVFYPSQRVSHLLWFPWARNLRDVAWTVYVTDDDRYPSVRYLANREEVRRRALQKAQAKDPKRFASPTSTADGEAEKLILSPVGGGDGGVSYGTLNSSPPPQAAPKPGRSSREAVEGRPEILIAATDGSRPRAANTVSVVHSFAVRNYIDSEAKAQTPAFLVQWAVIITLQKGTGEWVGATLEQPEVFCEPATSNKLLKLRRQRFCDTVFNRMGVHVQEVASLDP